MTFGEIQTSLTNKLGTSETITFTTVKRRQAINDAILIDLMSHCEWRELEVERPLTFLRRGRLVCGVTLLNTFSDWTGITDGSFRITVDGTAYNVDGIDISAATTMATVASIIQTAVRTATGGSETVNVYPTLSSNISPYYFVFASGTTGTDSAVAVLETTTGTEGTDLSGIAYLNGDNVNGEISTWVTSSIPEDYKEMRGLFELQSGRKVREYHYSPPAEFSFSASERWTRKDLFGTLTFFLNHTSNKTLSAEYRQGQKKLSDSTDTTIFSDKFKEPITLLAAKRLFMYTNHTDPRIQMYENAAFELLDRLRVQDRETSMRYRKTIRVAKRYSDPYGYGRSYGYDRSPQDTTW